MAKKDSLRWKFDVNTFRLIGRELITDRITAVYELVKNCYDANATEVVIHFENVGSDSQKPSRIIIEDNGCGMSFNDIKNKWMVVGTASKRTEKFSPKPFNRRYVGEKGIGRFAVDKLGGSVEISTKKEKSKQRLIVNINWDEYEKLSRSNQLTLFTDVDNGYYFEDANPDYHGTTLSLFPIKEPWSELDIKRLERELEKIVSPFFPVNPPFNISIKSNDYEEYKEKRIQVEAVKYSSHSFELESSQAQEYQEILVFDKEKGQINKEKVSIKSFGPITLKIFYFDEAAKKYYNRVYKNDDYRVDGIKIYRDGLITTPFAEYESNRDKKRDILGIDKRLWSGTFDKIGTREIIGVLDITKEHNPNIIDATNRQDFVDNVQYQDLKDFVIAQLEVLGELKKFERESTKAKTDIALQKANSEVKQFATVISEIEKKNPKLKSALKPLVEQAKQIDKSLKKGIQQQKRERQEHVRKENIYLSLMSLQEYAVHISHAVRTALGKVKRMAEFFKERFPDPKYEDLFKEYSVAIFEEMSNLNRIIDFMLSYAGSNIEMQDFNVKNHLQDLFTKSYRPVFDAEGIYPIIEIRDSFLLHANKKFFEDIFENLISNSLKALRHEEDKKIKCTGFIDGDNFVLYFSDNGEGIAKGNESKIFDMYYTTTADLGGAGIGLYIVKTRVESLKGSISVINSEFAPKGATFKISFPFNKEN